MKYIALIYTSDNGGNDLSEDEQKAVFGEYMALSDDPKTLGGDQLAGADTATTVRVDGGETLTTDGPFVETKEELGGYYVIDAGDLDEAVAFAARIPAARFGGAIEVRPVVEM
jgi:hypothetical protein